jgi:protein tyrosine/serine phosphatase
MSNWSGPLTTRRHFLIGSGVVATSALSETAGSSALARNKSAPRIDLPGAPNLGRVSNHLYRGAQPTRLGFENLVAREHIRTVVNLRASNEDIYLAAGLPLVLRHVGINTWSIGQSDDEGIACALAFVHQGMKRGRVLVHCRHGSDRTGAVVALYRIIFEKWEKERAIDEMTRGPFNFHEIWGNIPAFIRSADIEALKLRVLALGPLIETPA